MDKIQRIVLRNKARELAKDRCKDGKFTTIKQIWKSTVRLALKGMLTQWKGNA